MCNIYVIKTLLDLLGCIHYAGDDAAPRFSGRSYYDSNFYAFKMSTGEWMQLQPTGYSPKGRRSHVACKIILLLALH